MINKSKNYFTIFGILCATVNGTLQSIYSAVHAIESTNLPKIIKTLLSKQLKPIKSYSTNSI